MGLLPYRLALLLSTRTGAPAAAKAAVGYLEAVVKGWYP